jgi:hypothetical protein
MNLRHVAALALVGWYLMLPSKVDAQSHPKPANSGIRGGFGCAHAWGNAPAGTFGCGQVVDSKTGKDMGWIQCDAATGGFTKFLPEGKYAILWRHENRDESPPVSISKEKWTEISLGQGDCLTPNQYLYPQ